MAGSVALAATRPSALPVVSATNPRALPLGLAGRLIVALDVPTIVGAREMVARLDGVVSFFRIGLWLAFAERLDG